MADLRSIPKDELRIMFVKAARRVFLRDVEARKRARMHEIAFQTGLSVEGVSGIWEIEDMTSA